MNAGLEDCKSFHQKSSLVVRLRRNDLGRNQRIKWRERIFQRGKMMNPLRKNNRSLLATLLALALTLTTSTAALAQQKPQPDNNSDNQSSIISSILSLGSSVL